MPTRWVSRLDRRFRSIATGRGDTRLTSRRVRACRSRTPASRCRSTPWTSSPPRPDTREPRRCRRSRGSRSGTFRSRIEGMPDPADTVTVAPGLFVYDNDGIPTRIFSESPYQVPIAPLPVARHFLQEYHDKITRGNCSPSSRCRSGWSRRPTSPGRWPMPTRRTRGCRSTCRTSTQLRGGLQIKALAPRRRGAAREVSPTFSGLDDSARQHRVVVVRLAADRQHAREDGRERSSTASSSAWRERAPACRSSGSSCPATAPRSSATGSMRTRRSPTSARRSSTSSSAARRTRSCRCAASSIHSASTSCARSR